MTHHYSVNCDIWASPILSQAKIEAPLQKFIYKDSTREMHPVIRSPPSLRLPKMSAPAVQIPDGKLPTLTLLNASVPQDLDARQVAKSWFSIFSNAIESRNVQAVIDLLLPDSYWRDMLALTWDFRTFYRQDKISIFLRDRLCLMNVGNLKLREDAYLRLMKPYPDVAWIGMMFDFETGVGICSGIIRIVPTSNGEWKAHVVYTNLEDLKGFPEKINSLRDDSNNYPSWAQDRREAAEFIDKEPSALIIGGSQNGLGIAARLKTMGVTALVIEKTPRIGDIWRNRYEALCLHDPVCKLFRSNTLSYSCKCLIDRFRVRSYAVYAVRLND
jgi:hypothetical protein